ncbi:hypothetical protein JKF63_01448 [Porcisia hertigi]|uniref:Uncharacterized protein n=1 Tax=Porcisia hertigi TaxID=2761500 RepID=A0A836IEG5_9TRYP|nr:hypothetical protein JKF63_01448 [Porcisia hertigi]
MHPTHPIGSMRRDGGDVGLMMSSGLVHQQSASASHTPTPEKGLTTPLEHAESLTSAHPITQALKSSSEAPGASALLESGSPPGAFMTVHSPTPNRLGESALNLARLEPQLDQSPKSGVRAHTPFMSTSDTPHGVSLLPLASVPQPHTSPVTDVQHRSGAGFAELHSDKPLVSPLAGLTYETPLAVLASSSDSGSHKSKESGSNPQARPPSSSSSSRQSGNGVHAPPDIQPSPPSPPPPPPPPQNPKLPTAAAAANLLHFAPLIQQFDFHKTDIKNIASTSTFTMENVKTVPVKLRLLRHEVLSRAEPIANVRQAAMRAGRVKAPRPNSSTKQCESLPRVVDVADFHDTLVIFDNALLAISFALWGSVAPYNDLVRALLAFCVPDLLSHLKNSSKRNDVINDISPSERQRADAVAEAAASVSQPPTEKTRVRVSFSSVLRFLNHYGIDILVISANRKAASSFCAKRRHVHQGCCPPPADTSSATSPSPMMSEGDANKPGTSAAPLRRVLVALSYNFKEALWCPLTTSRPIRRVASHWHEYRRTQRRYARRNARRAKREADAEAAAKAENDAIVAKLMAWQQRTAPYRQKQHCEAGHAIDEPAPCGVFADAADSQPYPVTIPDSNNGGGSEMSTLKPGNRPPFHNVLYPNLVQTDVGFTLLLRQGLHPLFTMVRLHLTLCAPLGCITLLLGLALIIYVSKTTDVCLFDTRLGQCVDVRRSDSTGGSGCLALLSSLSPSVYQADIVKGYLYGPPSAPGNCLIVTICCNFAAVLGNVLMVYFAVRYLALGGTRLRFLHVLRSVQAVLGAIVCAFAAYVVFLLHSRFHILPCSSLAATNTVLCTAHLENCSDRYAYVAHAPLNSTNVALVLACVYLAFCVLHWLVAVLPVLPSRDTQDLVPTATPDTYAFRPNPFAPDGPTPAELDELQKAMQPTLRQELRLYTEARDRLLTTTTTIGEMMHANRVKSLKQMRLNEKRRQRRMRPFQKRPQEDGNQERAREGSPGKGQGYMALWGGKKLANRHSSSRSSSWSLSDSDLEHAHHSVVLAPRLVQRVAEIGARVQERGLPTETISPTTPVRTPFSEKGGKAPIGSSSALQPPRNLRASELSLHSTSAARARALVGPDELSISVNKTGDLAQRCATSPPYVSLSSRLFAPTDPIVSPKSEPLENVKLASTSSGEKKCSFDPPRTISRTPSIHSANMYDAGRSTVDEGIDRVVARLRARKAGAPGGAQ